MVRFAAVAAKIGFKFRITVAVNLLGLKLDFCLVLSFVVSCKFGANCSFKVAVTGDSFKVAVIGGNFKLAVIGGNFKLAVIGGNFN